MKNLIKGHVIYMNIGAIVRKFKKHNFINDLCDEFESTRLSNLLFKDNAKLIIKFHIYKNNSKVETMLLELTTKSSNYNPPKIMVGNIKKMELGDIYQLQNNIFEGNIKINLS